MTLAFSTKSNMWTTEYSFEPDHFAQTDGRMFAFNELGKTGRTTQQKLWIHDASSTRNLFYSNRYPSKLSIVSNENPSATKAYESVSLETSYKDWSMAVRTQEQQGSTSDFSSKENDQYASIPKDNRVTSANLTYVGTCAGDRLLLDNLGRGLLRMKTFSGKFAVGTLCFRNLAPGVAGVMEDARDGAVACIDQSGRRIGILDKGQNLLDVCIQVSSVNGADLVITNAPQEPLFDPATSVGNEEFYSATNQVEIWVASAESGESLKGDYIVVDLETSESPDNFELYAINVDQHNVNLDHSLGQNN